MKALLDTNILIDFLNGAEEARGEIALYLDPMISPITWMEVMAGAAEAEEASIRAFLARFAQPAINADIAEAAVALRREYRLRLPDAIIWATAKCNSALLVTRNTKDFPAEAPGVRVPYRL